jgi:hypothetical protein
MIARGSTLKRAAQFSNPTDLSAAVHKPSAACNSNGQQEVL